MALGVSLLFLGFIGVLVFILALGLLIVGAWPGGRPAAWEAGRAIPWPKPGEEPPEEDAGPPGPEDEPAVINPPGRADDAPSAGSAPAAAQAKAPLEPMKVAITGAGGDFGTAILRRLLPDERVDEVVGIDVVAPRIAHEKLRAGDLRRPRPRDPGPPRGRRGGRSPRLRARPGPRPAPLPTRSTSADRATCSRQPRGRARAASSSPRACRPTARPLPGWSPSTRTPSRPARRSASTSARRPRSSTCSTGGRVRIPSPR